MPKRCLDPREAERERQFAEHVLLQHAYLGDVGLGTQVAAYDDPNLADDVLPPTVFGGGYTSEIAQNFINAVENTIYVEARAPQDDALHAHPGRLPQGLRRRPLRHGLRRGTAELRLRRRHRVRIPFDQQTVDALNGGQAGNFRKVNADGSPDLAGGLDPDAPALFSPMHAARSGQSAAASTPASRRSRPPLSTARPKPSSSTRPTP